MIDLTPTENQVVKLLVTGIDNKTIADQLDMSEKTVKFHLTKIYKKFKVKSRLECVVKYLKMVN